MRCRKGRARARRQSSRPCRCRPGPRACQPRSAPPSAARRRDFSPARSAASPRQPPSGRGHAILRGRLTHKLLEELPKIAPGERAAAARRLLSLARYTPLADAREEILAETLRILDDSAFAHVFSPTSRAEVAVAGAFHDKEGRPHRRERADRPFGGHARPRPGRRLQDQPRGPRADDSGLHRADGGLSPSPPGDISWRPIEAALLFTSVPRLIPLPSELLDVASITMEGGAVLDPTRGASYILNHGGRVAWPWAKSGTRQVSWLRPR